MGVTQSMYARLLALAALGCGTAAMSGCEPVQDKYLATPLDVKGKPVPSAAETAEIIVSGEEWIDMSSRLFGAVEVTFENRSARWVHLRATSIQLGNETVDAAVYAPAGDDLWAWQQATVRRNALRSGFRRSGIAAPWSAAAGRLIPVASLRSVENEPAASPGSALTTRLFPPDHLLGQVISVPPGLFAKRWIVLHTPEPRTTGCLRQMQLGYQLDDGQVKYVRLPFRDQQSPSEWQAEECAEPIQGQPWHVTNNGHSFRAAGI